MPSGFFTTYTHRPPCAQLLGWELIDQWPDEGRIEIAFHPTEQLLNPRGAIQGGFVTAMLDDAMGPALVMMSGGKQAPVSLDINVTFIKPAFPGRLICKARVIKKGRNIAYLEGELFDIDGNLLARATSTAHIVETGHGQT